MNMTRSRSFTAAAGSIDSSMGDLGLASAALISFCVADMDVCGELCDQQLHPPSASEPASAHNGKYGCPVRISDTVSQRPLSKALSNRACLQPHS